MTTSSFTFSRLVPLCVLGIVFTFSILSAVAEPPSRGGERGAKKRTHSNTIIDYRNPGPRFRADWNRARDTVRRDFSYARNRVKEQTNRARSEFYRRRQAFKFERVLDSLFGRPEDKVYLAPPRQSAPLVQPSQLAPRRPQESNRFYREQGPIDQIEHQNQDLNPAPATERNPIEMASDPLVRELAPPQIQSQKNSDDDSAGVAQAPQTAPNVKEERDSSPHVRSENASSPSNPTTSSSKKKPTYPFGIPVPGKEGMVYSPYMNEAGKFVDVRNIEAGTLVKDPFSGKLFRVP